MSIKIGKIFTTGVYGKTEDEFYESLTDNNIGIFIDVRRRRGMRGKKYSFVNSLYLQKKLAELGVEYMHEKDLSPTEEIREAQKKEDERLKIQKRRREEMSEKFVELYKATVISGNTIEEFAERIGGIAAGLDEKPVNICLFCVEKDPAACHRSIIAGRLSETTGAEVLDL